MLKLNYFISLTFYSEPIIKLQQPDLNKGLDRKARRLDYTLLPIFTSSEMTQYDMINIFIALDRIKCFFLFHIIQTMRALLECLSYIKKNKSRWSHIGVYMAACGWHVCWRMLEVRIHTCSRLLSNIYCLLRPGPPGAKCWVIISGSL